MESAINSVHYGFRREKRKKNEQIDSKNECILIVSGVTVLFRTNIVWKRASFDVGMLHQQTLPFELRNTVERYIKIN